MKLKHIMTAAILACATLSACGGTPAEKQKPATTATPTAATPTMVVSDKVPADIAKTIKDTLEKNYADQKLSIQQINPTPIAGVYEIVANGKQIVYSDATGGYMLVGDLIETTQGRSLTEDRKAELSMVDFNTLPFDKAITEVRGNGALKVAVFSDADCPYCHRLENEFSKMTNITIYNFMMPLSNHTDAYRKSVQILCQPNPTKAWTEWMRANKTPPAVAQCARIKDLDATIALGETLGFISTPTLVFPNGKTQAGYAPMPRLQKIIEENQQ